MKGRISANAAVLIGIALLLLTTFILRFYVSPAAKGNRVNIYIDGELKETLALPAEGEAKYRIDTPEGFNLLVLDSAGVRMADADCPHKDCVSQGRAGTDNFEERPLGRWIVCLPHRISVELAHE